MNGEGYGDRDDAGQGAPLQRRTEVMLTEAGAADDRRFFVIDGRNRMVNNKRIGG